LLHGRNVHFMNEPVQSVFVSLIRNSRWPSLQYTFSMGPYGENIFKFFSAKSEAFECSL
jgi:hypothetical protein